MRQIWGEEEESGLGQVKSEMSFRISNSVTLRAGGWMQDSHLRKGTRYTELDEFDEGVSKKKIMIRKNIKPISINC